MPDSTINRQNAQHSTGPKTEDGKKRSSLNPLRHGLTAQLALLPGEDPEAYHIHSQVFAGDHDPQGSIEASLVQFLADVTWRLNRLTILESNLMTALIGLAGPALAAAVETQSKAMANFSIYSQRLTRQFERTASELRDLQKTRKLQDLKELNQMFDIISKYQDNELPSTQPAMASFFHPPKIQRAKNLRNRELRASDWIIPPIEPALN